MQDYTVALIRYPGRGMPEQSSNRSAEKPSPAPANRRLTVTLPASVLILAVLALLVYFVRSAPPDRIVIATGDPQGAYARFAREYQAFMRPQGVELEIRETHGSVENLKLLADPDSGVDIAFVQSGVGSPARFPGLVGIAGLYHEPLWVFKRRDLDVALLRDLRGKRIGVGAVGSGARQAALALLDENGVDAGNTALMSSDMVSQIEGLREGRLDAALLIASATSKAVSTLLAEADIELMDVVRAEAYARRKPVFSEVVLPRGAIDPARDIPATDKRMISPVATLVARKGFHPALISLVLQAASEAHAKPTLFDKAGEFPSASHVDFPIAKRSRRFFKNGPPFLQRYLPFWAATLIDRLVLLALPLVTLLFPLVKIVPPVYRWRVRSRIYSWYEQLLEIESNAEHKLPAGDIASYLHELDDMEDEVNAITVPLSYADNKYNLRMHIELVRTRLQEKLKRLA